MGSEEETKKRIEKPKLKRDVESGLKNLVSQEDNNPSQPQQDDVMDWSAKMRASSNTKPQKEEEKQN